jgi:hypothetical protein
LGGTARLGVTPFSSFGISLSGTSKYLPPIKTNVKSKPVALLALSSFLKIFPYKMNYIIKYIPSNLRRIPVTYATIQTK